MITLVLGGSGSGKSAYAEHLLDGKTNKYYIATMQVYDAEGGKKVASKNCFSRYRFFRKSGIWKSNF